MLLRSFLVCKRKLNSLPRQTQTIEQQGVNMPVYILRESFSNKFKIQRADWTIEAAAEKLRSAGLSSLTIFEVLEVEQAVLCEFILKRHVSQCESTSDCADGCFLLDPVEVLTIVRDVRRMFAKFDTVREAARQCMNTASTASLVEPTQEDRELIRRIQTNRDERDYLAFECESLENQLKQRIGSASGIRGLVSWKTQTSRIYSESIFRNSDPQLYQELLEQYYCLDTKAWRSHRPDQYKDIQTTYFSPRTCRYFKLLPAD